MNCDDDENDGGCVDDYLTLDVHRPHRDGERMDDLIHSVLNDDHDSNDDHLSNQRPGDRKLLVDLSSRSHVNWSPVIGGCHRTDVHANSDVTSCTRGNCDVHLMMQMNLYLNWR